MEKEGAGKGVDLHKGDAFLGLLVEQGNALLEALLVRLPGLQKLGLFRAVSILDCSWDIHVLHGIRLAHHAGDSLPPRCTRQLAVAKSGPLDYCRRITWNTAMFAKCGCKL